MAGRGAVVLVTAAVVAAGGLGAGVALATAAGGGVKACETGKHVLVVPKSGGGCPSGASAVTIGQQGPRGRKGARGPAGPGAGALVASSNATSATKTMTLADGDTIAVRCTTGDSGDDPSGSVELTGKGASVIDYASMAVTQSEGNTDWSSPNGFVSYTGAAKVASFFNQQDQTFTYLASGSDHSGDAQLTVVARHGKAVYTIRAAVSADQFQCFVVAQVIPAS